MNTTLTNEMRLKKMTKDTPLVTGDEKILVIGAAGQIGTKLIPELKKLYPDSLLLCDKNENKEKGIIALDVTDEKALRGFLSDKKNNVKAVINLAALLSSVAEQRPELAHKINFDTPRNLMKIMNELNDQHKQWKKSAKTEPEPHTIRKLQIMSSMASQEFGIEEGDSADVAASKQSLQNNASTKVRFPAKGKYGRQKSSIEVDADYYVSQCGLDISIPCLAGVLNAHTPWPADGTTEELDKMVVAAALFKVYGADQWESKLRKLIVAQDNEKGAEALKKGYYIHEGQYVPAVTGDTKFAMIDGNTLAESVLMLLHQDSRKSGPVQNLYEYTSRMMDAARYLQELSPGFKINMPAKARDLRDKPANIYEPGRLLEHTDPGKMHRAAIWAFAMDTTPTEGVIGNFKRFDEKQSIKAQFDRAVEFFKKMKLSESSVAVAPQQTGADRVA